MQWTGAADDDGEAESDSGAEAEGECISLCVTSIVALLRRAFIRSNFVLEELRRVER